MYLLYHSAFAKCIVIIFFGNWIIFLHQSLSGSQEFQQMEWFVYTTWKFPGWGRKAKLKQKSVTDEKRFCLCSLYDRWSEMLFVVVLLFHNSRHWANLYLRFALQNERFWCEATLQEAWPHWGSVPLIARAVFKRKQGLARPAFAKSQGWALPGSCSRNTLHQPSHGLSGWRGETYLHACVNCEMDFPGLKDFGLTCLLIYLSAEE